MLSFVFVSVTHRTESYHEKCLVIELNYSLEYQVGGMFLKS